MDIQIGQVYKRNVRIGIWYIVVIEVLGESDGAECLIAIVGKNQQLVDIMSDKRSSVVNNDYLKECELVVDEKEATLIKMLIL